jgi:hypothetical protein
VVSYLLSSTAAQRAEKYTARNGVYGFFAGKISALATIEMRERERTSSKKSATEDTEYHPIMSLKVLEDFVKRDLQSQFGNDDLKSVENFKRFYKFFIGMRMYRNYECIHGQQSTEEVRF